MSVSGAHRSAFRREVTQEGRVFAIRDGDGYPAPLNTDGGQAVPFWSKPTRAQRIVAHVNAYRGFEVVPLAVDAWMAGWLSSLERDGLLVGVNWAGARATGYDMTPAQVLRWFAEAEEPIVTATQR